MKPAADTMAGAGAIFGSARRPDVKALRFQDLLARLEPIAIGAYQSDGTDERPKALSASEAIAWLAQDVPGASGAAATSGIGSFLDRWSMCLSDNEREKLKPAIVRLALGRGASVEAAGRLGARWLAGDVLAPCLRIAGADDDADRVAQIARAGNQRPGPELNATLRELRIHEMGHAARPPTWSSEAEQQWRSTITTFCLVSGIDACMSLIAYLRPREQAMFRAAISESLEHAMRQRLQKLHSSQVRRRQKTELPVMSSVSLLTLAWNEIESELSELGAPLSDGQAAMHLLEQLSGA